MNPDLDSTPLSNAATTMHEWFTSLVEAGFNENQAIALMIGLSRGNFQAE